MIASEGLNLGTALAHLQNLSREFETLEAATIKARTELDRLTQFLEQATQANDESQTPAAETCDPAEASFETALAGAAIADETAEPITAAPADATPTMSNLDEPARDEHDIAPEAAGDLETAFYRTVADLFAPGQPAVNDQETTAADDGFDNGLNGLAMLEDRTRATAPSLAVETESEVMEDEPLFDFFAAHDETVALDEPAETPMREIREASSMDETDHQRDEVAEINQPEPVREAPVALRHDPEMFGFQGMCLTTEAACASDAAVPTVLSDPVNTETLAPEFNGPDEIVDRDTWEVAGSLFDSLTEELNLAVDEPEQAVPEEPEEAAALNGLFETTVCEPSATDLQAPLSEIEPAAQDEPSVPDGILSDQAQENTGILASDDAHQSRDTDQTEADPPAAGFRTEPETDDVASTPFASVDEPIDDQGPRECFSAMHQPISFEEPTIESLVVSVYQPVGQSSGSDDGEADASSRPDIAPIEPVATIEPVAELSQDNAVDASTGAASEQAEEASLPVNILPTAQDDATAEVSVQDVAVEDEAAATVSQQNQIVALPNADESPAQRPKGRGRATTIAGLGAIAATLAVALHPPIADEILSLPWQDMLHMNEILDRLSELKRFFAFA